MQQRQDYITWEDYFMGIAVLAAQRSKDPRRQVGACIVDQDRRIVGVGYNGAPLGCSDDIFPWGRNDVDPLNHPRLYVCHAAINAIVMKTSMDVKGCTMYTTLFPCNENAKVIVQSGITHLKYLSKHPKNQPRFEAARRLFTASGVNVEQYTPTRNQIVINFTDAPN